MEKIIDEFSNISDKYYKKMANNKKDDFLGISECETKMESNNLYNMFKNMRINAIKLRTYPIFTKFKK